jgi:hypothetical protein
METPSELYTGVERIKMKEKRSFTKESTKNAHRKTSNLATMSGVHRDVQTSRTWARVATEMISVRAQASTEWRRWKNGSLTFKLSALCDDGGDEELSSSTSAHVGISALNDADVFRDVLRKVPTFKPRFLYLKSKQIIGSSEPSRQEKRGATKEQ